MTVRRIPLWVDLRHVPINKRLPYLHVSEEVACERLLLARGDPHVERPGVEAVVLDGNQRLKHRGQAVGRLIRVSDGKSQEKAARAGGLVVVDAEEKDWRIIPLENLVAARRDRPGTLFALARSPQQAALFADTLETGVHGIVLAPESPQAIVEADQELRKRWKEPKPAPAAPVPASDAARSSAKAATATTHAADGPQIAQMANPSAQSVDAAGGKPATAARANGHAAARPFLEAATVTSIADGGMGDRVCLDTTSLFRDGEGLLVGSTARSFCLVHAETLPGEYIQPRPFRVNAGAVHMYLFAPEGKTRYLSELGAGAPVLAVHPDGIHRVLTVGRAKIERRPHTLLQWTTADGRVASAMLQTAETIRLVRPDGRPVGVTELVTGDTILVHNEEAARHTGLPVDAALEER